MPKAAKKQLRASRGEAVDEADDAEDDDEPIDRLTAADAYLFPVLGSCVLFGLFLAFKYLGKDLSAALSSPSCQPRTHASGRSQHDPRILFRARRNGRSRSGEMSSRWRQDARADPRGRSRWSESASRRA